MPYQSIKQKAPDDGAGASLAIQKMEVVGFYNHALLSVDGYCSPMALKNFVDNVIGNNRLPVWLARMESATIAFVLITIFGFIDGYINTYFTESVARTLNLPELFN